jgi:hypothetical protein
MPYNDELLLRATVIGGETAPDDFQVFWNGGSSNTNRAFLWGEPNWHWAVAFPGQPQPSAQRGHYSDLAECKRRFKVVWTAMRATLRLISVPLPWQREVNRAASITIRWLPICRESGHCDAVCAGFGASC